MITPGAILWLFSGIRFMWHRFSTDDPRFVRVEWPVSGRPGLALF